MAVNRSAVFRFLGFALVGCAGFVVDAGVLALVLTPLGPYWGRAVSFLCAVSATYVLNRIFVFAEAAKTLGWAAGWAKFIAANAVGAGINLGVYAALTPMLGPFAALALGSIAGLGVNFALSAGMVFRHRQPPPA